MELSPNNKPVLRQEETPPAGRDNPPVGLARVPSARSVPGDGLAEQLSASTWTAGLVSPVDLKYNRFLKCFFRRGKKGLFTNSLKMFLLRFVCEIGREGGERTVIFQSME